jgi:hypothetical protein
MQNANASYQLTQFIAFVSFAPAASVHWDVELHFTFATSALASAGRLRALTLRAGSARIGARTRHRLREGRC